MTCVTSEKPPAALLVFSPGQDDKLEVVESSEDDVGSAVHIRGLSDTAYNHIGIYARR